MRASAIFPAVLALGLALMVSAPCGLAGAQPRERANERAHERSEARRDARLGGGERPPAYGAPPVFPARPHAYPRPAAPAYPPPAYDYAPRPGYLAQPGYAPNSLGAGWGQQQDAARRGVRQGGLMPLRQVMANIRRGTPGRLLDAGLEPGPGGRPAYRVRWAAANGERIDFIVDAASGAIVGSSGY